MCFLQFANKLWLNKIWKQGDYVNTISHTPDISLGRIVKRKPAPQQKKKEQSYMQIAYWQGSCQYIL